MRTAIVLAGLLLAACGSATAVEPAAAPAAGTTPAVTILANDGGVLRPITNGGRVALREGWATVTLSPVPMHERGDLEVKLFGADGRAVTGDVRVSYESIDMDHGQTTEAGVLHGDCYRMRLAFVMPGAWRLHLHVTRDGLAETVTIVLPSVGL